MPGFPAPKAPSSPAYYSRVLSPRSRASSIATTPLNSYHTSLDTSEDVDPLSPASGHVPIALSPTVTVKGSSRSRASSSASSARSSHHSSHHRSHSPPRSPQNTRTLYDHALEKAGNETSEITDKITERQIEILSRKHDIAVWQRKIAAAEKLINKLNDQVDVLLHEANSKIDLEKELASERDALQTTFTEKEWNALGLCLSEAESGRRHIEHRA